MKDRYGIDVGNPGATEQDISSAVTQAQAARQHVEAERSNTGAVRGDEFVASAAVTGANREDRERANNSAEPAYDSPERRQQLAKRLENYPDREAVNALLMADRHQGTPPSAAVNSTPSVGKTSKIESSAQGQAVERGGLAR